MGSGHLPRRDLTRLQIPRAEPLTQRARLDLVKPVLTSETGSPATRAAACLMLLYAQPASGIVRLTVDDITRDGDQILFRLGDSPVPVPEPFAALLLVTASQRGNMDTATNPYSRWLFPGRRAGQPLRPGSLREQIRVLGIPIQAARIAALRQLVLQAPAPGVAQALGYHSITTQWHPRNVTVSSLAVTIYGFDLASTTRAAAIQARSRPVWASVDVTPSMSDIFKYNEDS
ncbi:hypothetical protein [Frankia sp. R43]|uniref:hypothetical protein n=1 Tax=Frankia sp. R43 TaxID=269536 RepID=UPI0007C7E957|nr:hypothetical protein [Frankia sp. R43]